jgi:DNA mismatch endonuclease, patch repair protein
VGISRGENMRRIRSKDTMPEMAVRRLLHGMGYRYCLHRRDIPGKPDLVFPGRRKVIFIHGCFWHQHSGCREGRLPKSNTAYWLPKLERNRARDKAALEQLAASGWSAFVVWECEIADIHALIGKIRIFLEQ